MLTAVSKETCAELRKNHVMITARSAEDLTAERYVRDINPLLATNRQIHHMFATHVMTGGTVLKTGMSILPSMQMQQPAAGDPKAGRESV